MSLLTDPRQIVKPLPPSMLEKITHGTRRDCKNPAKRGTPRDAQKGKNHNQQSKQVATVAPAKGCCSKELCIKHYRDRITGKTLKECWSLSKSKDWHGELPVPSAHTREVVTQEAILQHGREQDPRWKDFV